MTDSEKLDFLLSEIQIMNQGLQTVKQEVQTVKQEVQTIKQEVQTVKQKVTRIELTLENEIDHNIKIIAEGHLDLSRKLNEAIKIASDIQAKQELQDIYITNHEFKLKAL